MRVHGLGRVGLSCALIALAAFGCKTEPADNSGGVAGTAPLPGAGTGVPASGTGGGAGVAAAGTGAAGATAAGSGAAGTLAAGTGGMTAAGTGGMTAAGTGGMTAAGTGGMTAAGTGGTPAMTDSATCIADAAAMGRTGACTECGCMKCLAEIMACQDEACAGVVSCGQMAGCKGRDCYCGVGVDPITCALTGATGPCMNEIADASGVCDGGNAMCASALSAATTSSSVTYDADNPVSRANAVSICTRGQDAAEAVPLANIPAAPEIMGMCETECNQ